MEAWNLEEDVLDGFFERLFNLGGFFLGLNANFQGWKLWRLVGKTY